MAHLHDAIAGLEPFSMVAVLEKITPDEVLARLAAHLDPAHRTISILRPLGG
jgi:hypothetical protein